MISHETVTPLNYRMTVSGRSDFPTYNNFPEVYHAHGISKAAFSGGERAVTGEGRDTTYSVKEANNTAAYCVSWPLSAGRAPADPEQTIFGSARRETRKGYDNQAKYIKSY